MDPAFQALLGRLDPVSDQYRELKEGVRMAVKVADLDPEMALTRCRKVLEIMVRDLFEKRIQEPAGTQPLEGLLQRLFKNDHLPPLVNAYANGIRELGNIGTHKFQTIAVGDVSNSLSQLISVVEWYVQGAPGNPEPTKKQPPKPSTPEPAKNLLAIVPKGLRSFDAGDAKFFLELLPGPRDEKGLPESIRFWKYRIDTAKELTFTVGVIYGPSGCGKSSLIQAGLLPKLSDRVFSVYVEATADDTEARLLRALRKRCPNLPTDLDLPATLQALGQGKSLNKAQKVLLAVDQFEQWLNANRGEKDTELARALRQCDGERVQCLLLVRDDFWTAMGQFMDDLHIGLSQGRNMARVDLFDANHSSTVLSAFGRAFEQLPEEPSKEQKAFIDQAVAGLAHNHQVICVRLALFAEMVKARPWVPATLKEVGGAEGVGVAFLEETFSSATASPRNRVHQEAARAVLKALLPEQGSDIKGNMQSHDKLLQASGYARRPGDFEELLRILDGEVRLITPTQSPEGASPDEPGPAAPVERYYQLTHDYLVHSLRDWLTRKQKETRRGRAELRLAERAALWTAKPESRHLPAWWEWANIHLLTRKGDWSSPQRKMMRKATRYHALRGLALALLLLVVTLTGLRIRGQVIEENKATHAAGLVRQLLDAEIAQVPGIIAQMKDYRRWTDPLLKNDYAEAEAQHDSRKQLHASLALLPVDPGQVEYLYERLLKAEPQEVGVLRDALLAHKDQLDDRLWTIVEQPPKGDQEQRLRAASALAAYDPDNARWAKASGPVVEQLVSINPVFLGSWLEGFRPIKDKLVAPLSVIFRDRQEERTAERSLATSILADYAADQPDRLADLVQDADEKQFAILYPKLEAHRERAVALMSETLATALESKKTNEDKERLAKRQANAAVTLLRLGQANRVWQLLKHPSHPQPQAYGFSDPRVRSYLIHRLSPLGADPKAIVQRLEEEKEVSIRRALLLVLGEFGPDQLVPADREPLILKVFQLYQDNPDPGLHGAAEWLLRQWGQQEKIKVFEQEWARAEQQQQRKERQEQIRRELARQTGRGEGYWYVNGQGQTMVVIAGPVEFLMGSPPTEEGRTGGPEGILEQQHRKRIGRSFAVAAKEVTVKQFGDFLKSRKESIDAYYNHEFSPTVDCPLNDLTWYDAAAYCNWLSEQEGIPKDQWCYKANATGEYAEGMKLAPDYLEREGYRLPSEAEWEYACRAGTVTSRYYGETEELLGKYAWYTKNSQDRGMLPGALGKLGVPGNCLKPNDLGLFDMLGNALEWCQESIGYYSPGKNGTASDDVEDKKDIKDKFILVLRGGSFLDQASGVRSAPRYSYVPTIRLDSVGFRPARTIIP